MMRLLCIFSISSVELVQVLHHSINIRSLTAGKNREHIRTTKNETVPMHVSAINFIYSSILNLSSDVRVLHQKTVICTIPAHSESSQPVFKRSRVSTISPPISSHQLQVNNERIKLWPPQRLTASRYLHRLKFDGAWERTLRFMEVKADFAHPRRFLQADCATR